MPRHPRILIDDVTGNIVEGPEGLTPDATGGAGGRYLDGEQAEKYMELKAAEKSANKSRDKAPANK